ncbi:MAG: AbrB/MazE/SpoVT family DNA-binding domain-containing protein [Promethearchaeota archaeon]
MKIRRKIGPKGQIVIPKDVRDMLNIRPGSEILIEIGENEITIRAAQDNADFLNKFIQTPKKLAEKIDYKKILDEQYERC